MKKIVISGLILGLLSLSGCFGGVKETANMTREFFQMVANGQNEEAYDMTSDLFKEYTSYEDFVYLVEYAELTAYLDFQTTGFESSIEDGMTIQTLYGDWYDTYGDYPIEVYWSKINDVWYLDGFYFVPADEQ